ncbi:MAG: pyruvate synthase subunit PorD [Methanomassiliicoccales archaeon]
MSGDTSHDVPEGGSIDEPGKAKEYKTGSWRSKKPVLDKEKCIDCLTCWIFCPDDCIIIEDEKMEGIRYDYCKGCGICASVCPKEAIEMEEEGE